MKKVSGKFVAMELGGVLLASLIIGLVAALTRVQEDGFSVSLMLIMAMVFFFWLTIFWFLLAGTFLKKVITKTMDKSDEVLLSNSGTFTTDNAILRIDTVGGQVAYVCTQNPFELQVVSAKDITDIQTWHNKGAFNSTSYVAFQFYCKGKKIRMATFIARRSTYSMNSKEVQTALSKADTYCGLLNAARQTALGGGAQV